MIRIEIVGQTIADFREKVEALFVSLGIRDQPPITPAPPAAAPLGRHTVVEEKHGKRRAAKGAGSEPEVIEAKAFEEPKHTVEVAKVVDGSRPLVEIDAGVTAAMVRESLLALLQIGDDEPEVVLAAFQVKKISLLKPEEFAAVKAAADKRLKEWQDAK